MPDKSGPGQEPKENRQFIREKIVQPPMTRRQIAKRITLFLVTALLGGAAAGVGFGTAKPFAEKYLIPEPSEESTPITIPKDEPESTSQEEVTVPETEETEPIEEIFQSAIEEYEYTAQDLDHLFQGLYQVAQKANKSIVQVHSVKEERDWFDNPVSTAGLYAGAIIASGNHELLILTPECAVEFADSIQVTFSDGTEVSGNIKAVDGGSDLAIVSVDTDLLEESTLEEAQAFQLGNSFGVKQGDILIALGAPAGMVHSINYGLVSQVMRNVQTPDGLTRLLYTDMRSDAARGTFLVNISGEIVGWVIDQYTTESSSMMTVGRGISDYKSALEKMSNGKSIPYLGVKGQEVTASMAANGLPYGVYVTDSILNGPAYNAGIQNGDIIVKIGTKEVTTMKDYQNQLESQEPGSEIAVVVQRKGIEEYKELEYQVTVGAR